MREEINIQSRDFWFKVIDMLQQNWALIETEESGVTVYFISDSGGVFDELSFPNSKAAVEALRRNRFGRYAEDPEAGDFMQPPAPPYHCHPHPNGPIYSSGRFWVLS